MINICDYPIRCTRNTACSLLCLVSISRLHIISFHRIMKGQHVLITGAAGGIGSTLARVFLEQGAHVSLHYHRTNQTLIPLLEQYADHCHALSVDATDEQAVEKSIEENCRRFGLINVCIINHATFVDDDIPIWDMPLAQWQRTLDVNLTSYFLYAREWCRQLKRLKPIDADQVNASLILVGSTAGRFGEANHLDYASSKGALQSGFIKSLKNEIVQILPQARCNIVAPGWTRTPMAEQSFEQGKHLKALRTTSLRKVATTDDVAQACLFFASNRTAGHLTGNVLMLHGGMEGRVLWSEDLE
jgi:NAD(P)-dependent dehydrogenase (short-subunit alcohol dehydrogenase family)